MPRTRKQEKPEKLIYPQFPTPSSLNSNDKNPVIHHCLKPGDSVFYGLYLPSDTPEGKDFDGSDSGSSDKDDEEEEDEENKFSVEYEEDQPGLPKAKRSKKESLHDKIPVIDIPLEDCIAFNSYRGKTNCRKRRLSQHCKRLKSGGARYTTMKLIRNSQLCDLPVIWKFILNVRGFQTERQLSNFEYITKTKAPRVTRRKKQVSLELRKKIDSLVCKDGRKILPIIRDILQALNMQNWCKKSPPASSIFLSIDWYEPYFRPEGLETVLPSYVGERFVSFEEKHELLRTHGREKPWPYRPY